MFLQTVPATANCKDLLDAGNDQSGVYTIHMPGSGVSKSVYCDQQSDGGGWLVSVILYYKKIPTIIIFYRVNIMSIS